MKPLFATGVPWFMTVFGRDSEIRLAANAPPRPGGDGALDALAELRATTEDPAIDAEPGKIVHEFAAGARPSSGSRATTAPSTRPRSSSCSSRRRGAGRTTRRSSPGSASPRCARSSGSIAGATATATASSSTARVPTAACTTSPGRTRAIHNASARSLRRASDRAGRGAGIRLPGEARARGARPGGLARARARGPAGVGGRRVAGASTRPSGSRARVAATTLWRSTGRREKVDARCSNMGHLLWSGIALPERVAPVVDELLSESLWSSWGIRRWAGARRRTTRSATTTGPPGPARHVDHRMGPRAAWLRGRARRIGRA